MIFFTILSIVNSHHNLSLSPRKMKLIKDISQNLRIKLIQKRKFIYNKIASVIILSFIGWILILGVGMILPSYSLSQPLKNNTCEQVDECLILSQVAEKRKFNLEKTDLKDIIEHQITFIKEIRKIYGKNSLSRIGIIFFMTIGPIKIIPVFVKLTENASKQVRIKLAIRSWALSTSAIMAVALTSQNILDKYKISLSALIAAAGIVLFLISLKMLLAQYDTRENNPLPTPENPLHALISPLTFPTILTPQGIALVMISMTIAQRLDNNAHNILGLIIMIMTLNLICMLYARPILNVLKPSLLKVLSTVLSIIQLALAISFLFSAINLQILTIYYILGL